MSAWPKTLAPIKTPVLFRYSTEGKDMLDIGLLPLPDPMIPGQVTRQTHILHVAAVGLGRGDLLWPEPASQSCPVPGYDVAGTVVSAPEGSPFPPGTRVFGLTSISRQGNARHFTIAEMHELARVPPNLSLQEAASVPTAALTAWQALFQWGQLEPPMGARSKGKGKETPVKGDKVRGAVGVGTSGREESRKGKEVAEMPEEDEDYFAKDEIDPRAEATDANNTKSVLVTAAAGSVGIWAVQLARLAGAGHIVGTCGPSNVDFVLGLGAHEVFDYTTQQDMGVVFGTPGRKFDLVLDCVGEETLVQAWKCVKKGGMIISIAEDAEAKRPLEHETWLDEQGSADRGMPQPTLSAWFVVKPDQEVLERIARLLEEWKCRTAVDSVHGWFHYGEAITKVFSRHLRGRVILSVNTDPPGPTMALFEEHKRTSSGQE